MARVVAIEVQISQVDRTAAGEWGMHIGEIGNGMRRQPDFPMRNEAEELVQWFTQAGADEGACTIGPGHPLSGHWVTRSSSARSAAVTR